MTRRAAVLIFAGALVLIDALGRILSGETPSLIEPEGLRPATPAATPPEHDEEAAFRAGFAPLLARVAAEAQALVTLGARKERNLLRLRAAQAATNERLNTADAWLQANPPPDDEAEAIVAAYREGAAAVRAAMGEAQAGWLRLDFERVARATETMQRGEAALQRALNEISEHES